MNINDRLKKIRIDNKMSQEEFGKRIALARSHISSLENGTRELTERTIKDICREFNVNEEWLRYGQGEIYIQPETFSLDEYAKSKNLTPLELDIIKGYIELDSNIRQSLMSHFKAIFDKHAEIAATKEDKEDYINREVENYRRELEAEQKGEISSVLHDTKENLG